MLLRLINIFNKNWLNPLQISLLPLLMKRTITIDVMIFDVLAMTSRTCLLCIIFNKKLKLLLYLETVIFQRKERLKTCSIIVQKVRNYFMHTPLHPTLLCARCFLNFFFKITIPLMKLFKFVVQMTSAVDPIRSGAKCSGNAIICISDTLFDSACVVLVMVLKN
ncbi:hypothetical protein T01_8222 [Trichinella spiralis]|uniref:Uncharacterized protein n=1 Tax=Trichinella spiralis TaxID=6334 RepID=A0A0V1BNB0_TRISP|nr:hypothetical protein T01_8222 [Trichinella spiralis]